MPHALILAALLFQPATAAAAHEWRLDAATSQVHAAVPFLGFGRRTARFPAVTGSLVADPAEPGRFGLEVIIDARQLAASDALTTSRLRGPGFFDVAHFPTVRFSGERLTLRSPVSGDVAGRLTARGITRPLTLAVSFARPIGRAAPGETIELTASGRLDRRDFGMRAYPLIVGSQVTLNIRARLEPAR